jgi:septal ring factor EnvC (AmiA/AmiB activator)
MRINTEIIAMSRAAQKDSFYAVKETCPEIDRANDAFINVVKKCTVALRDALTEKCEETLELTDQIADLEKKVDKQTDEIAELLEQIKELEAQLASVDV